MSGFNSCKDDDDVTLPTDYEQTPEKGTAKGGVLGMYLLNEGNMGSNKCTLDFLDFSTGLYARNIYPEKNPEVVLELGDVGNDEIIYDGRLFISVSGSNKMEVLDARSARRIGKVDVSNSRMLAAGDGHVYVGSYTGAIQVDPSVKAGVVYKVDARTLTVVDSYSTPYWPEGMAYIDGKLYVATSGTAIAGDYPSNDILVIDPLDMSLESTISVGPNLNKLKADSKGRLWVSSRGDYVLLGNLEEQDMPYYLCNLKEKTYMKIDAFSGFQEEVGLYLAAKEGKILLTDGKEAYLVTVE